MTRTARTGFSAAVSAAAVLSAAVLVVTIHGAISAAGTLPRPPTPTPRPTGFGLHFKSSSRHSCSRSYASTTRQGALRLKLVRNRAELVMEFDEHRSFGPSLGAFRRGARHFSHRTERKKLVWTGAATKLPGGGVELSLKPGTSLCTTPSRPGVRGAPHVPCPKIPPLRLKCRRGFVQAYGTEPPKWPASVAKKGEKTRPVRAFLCAVDATASGARHQAVTAVLEPVLKDSTIPLKAGIRLRLFKSKWRWGMGSEILRSP